MERVADNKDIGINPQFFYYLKLGNFQYADEETGEPVFEQNGQYYMIDPRSSLLFKSTS